MTRTERAAAIGCYVLVFVVLPALPFVTNWVRGWQS